MKQELIEYHRAMIKGCEIAARGSGNGLEEHRQKDKEFHERAVAWLEGLGRHEQFDAMEDGEFLKMLFAQARRRHLNIDVSDGLADQSRQPTESPMTPGHARFLKEKSGTI